MTIKQLHRLFLKFPQLSTDTRKITQNCIFFALKGENFNGNKYASEALQKGASYVIVDEAKYAKSDQYLVVDDVLVTLQKLSAYHRNYCSAKIIALTGSNGKTTTKELINEVLSKKYKTVATVGNLNNHIGVPLTLLSIQKDTEMAIVEMGANHLNEIAFLCSLAQPDYGYITNFGKAHLEGFGSELGVIKGKSELYDYLITHDKSIFLNADDTIQEEKLKDYIKKIGYSKGNHKYTIIQFLSADPYVSMKVGDMTLSSQLIGKYNFTNCSAAILIGTYFNVSLENIKMAIENYVPKNNRSQLIVKKGHKIILDAYNANPTSMRAALENFKNMQGENKTVFLGDMFELGNVSGKEHQQIADIALQLNFDKTFLIGANFSMTQTDSLQFGSFDDLSIYLREHPLKTGSILIKGSRGMALERILDLL